MGHCGEAMALRNRRLRHEKAAVALSMFLEFLEHKVLAISSRLIVGGRRKFLEHLVQNFLDFLFIFFGLITQGIASTAKP